MTKIGILGGGQLGRMLAEASQNIDGVSTHTLDAAGCPASQVQNDQHFVGSFKDATSVQKFAEHVDVLTVEIEHVNTDVLAQLADGPTHKETQPHWRTLQTIQDKYAQKRSLEERSISLPPYAGVEVANDAGIQRAARELGGFPIMLKARRNAYDGRGNAVVRSAEDIAVALQTLSGGALYAEKLLDFRMELAVMVVKTSASVSLDYMESTLAYPAVETVHQDSICVLTYCPPRGVDDSITSKAQILARKAVAGFEGRGIFGVEMFLMPNGPLMVNEIAPRVHNSGHWTLSPAAKMSQFEAHLRAVSRRQVQQSDLEAVCPSIMLNILGGAEPLAHLQLAELTGYAKGATFYLYGKGKGTPGRKMGHIVVTAPTMKEAERVVQPLIDLAAQIRIGANKAKEEARLAQSSGQGEGQTQGQSAAPGASSSSATSTIPPTITQRHCGIAVTMGSKSDLPVLVPGLRYLQSLSLVPFVTITSAHRTPDLMASFGKALVANGFKVAIAAAGGAAHLPGMLAAHTTLPVVGVPVKPSIGDGTDSLLSIVNMPRGCAVATVGVNNSVNAAQLAVRILAAFDEGVRRRFEESLEKTRAEVRQGAVELERGGWEAFAG